VDWWNGPRYHSHAGSLIFLVRDPSSPLYDLYGPKGGEVVTKPAWAWLVWGTQRIWAWLVSTGANRAPTSAEMKIPAVIAVGVYMCLFLLVAQWWRDYSEYRAREREEKRRAKGHDHF